MPPDWESHFLTADFIATFGRRNPEIIRAIFDPNADDVAVAEIGEIQRSPVSVCREI